MLKDNKKRIELHLSPFAPSVIVEIAIPPNRDSKEYIDELLDSILKDEFKYNAEWDFA